MLDSGLTPAQVTLLVTGSKSIECTAILIIKSNERMELKLICAIYFSFYLRSTRLRHCNDLWQRGLVVLERRQTLELRHRCEMWRRRIHSCLLFG